MGATAAFAAGGRRRPGGRSLHRARRGAAPAGVLSPCGAAPRGRSASGAERRARPAPVRGARARRLRPRARRRAARPRPRPRARAPRASQTRSAAGVGEALDSLTRLMVVGVLAAAVTAHDGERLTASCSHRSPCSRSPRSTPSCRSPGRCASCPRASPPVAASSSSTDPGPDVRDPDVPAALPPALVAVALEGVSVRYRDDDGPRPRGFDLRLDLGRGRPGRAERRRQDHGDAPPVPLPRPRARTGHDRRPRRARATTGRRSPHVRPRGTGRAPVLVDDPPEPAPRATRGDGRRAGPPSGARAWTTGRLAAPWPRHLRRRGRASALGRSAPAPRPWRAHCCGRAVLILDEPTAHLDPETAGSSCATRWAPPPGAACS